MYWYGVKGAPDIVCVVDGQYVGIEVKSPSGRQNEAQKAFQKSLEEAGGRYILARSVDDVIYGLSDVDDIISPERRSL